MPRPSQLTNYTPQQEAQVYLNLILNDGNITKTARETGMSRTTIYAWKKRWDTEGLGDDVRAMVDDQNNLFAAEAEALSFKALAKLAELIEMANEPKHIGMVNAAMGTLFDKVRLSKGLATRKTEHQVTLPSPEEARELLGGLARELGNAAAQRRGVVEVLDVEVVEEQPAVLTLPVPTKE